MKEKPRPSCQIPPGLSLNWGSSQTCSVFHLTPTPTRRQVVSKVTNLNSSISSRIMFRMKWNCREVSGAAPSCPTTSVFWDSEEDTATAAAGPEALNRTRSSETSGPRPTLSSPWKQLYLLRWGAESRGQANRSSTETGRRSLCRSWALELMRAGPTDSDWFVGVWWAEPLLPDWTCWPHQTVEPRRNKTL